MIYQLPIVLLAAAGFAVAAAIVTLAAVLRRPWRCAVARDAQLPWPSITKHQKIIQRPPSLRPFPFVFSCSILLQAANREWHWQAQSAAQDHSRAPCRVARQHRPHGVCRHSRLRDSPGEGDAPGLDIRQHAPLVMDLRHFPSSPSWCLQQYRMQYAYVKGYSFCTGECRRSGASPRRSRRA